MLACIAVVFEVNSLDLLGLSNPKMRGVDA